jgi:hypothetical protein
LATSEDPFLFERYSAEPNIGPEVAEELTCVFDPVVRWDGSLYRMWYTGSVSDRFAPQELRFASPVDGKVWEDYALNPVLQEATRSPSIVAHDSPTVGEGAASTYEMWYGTGGLSYATSMDGLSWANGGSVTIVGENDNHGNAAVLLIGNTYHMWYTATTSFVAWPYIRHATSEWTVPRASFVARAESTPAGVGLMGRAPLTVAFDATASVSPAAGGITEYTWHFGNGSKGAGVETRNVFTHGSYSVCLVVKDAAGNVGQGTRSIVALQEASPLVPWTASDVGKVTFGGAVRELDGCWEAAEAWGFVGLNSDDFHYVYQEVTGDFLIEAEVTVPTGAARNSRLGLMARLSLDPGSPMVYNHIRGGRLRGARRELAGELVKTNVLHRLGDEETTVGLRLQRSGDVFTGFYSLDGGTTWIADRPQLAEDFPSTIPVGIALSGSPSNLLSTWRVCQVQLRQEATTTPFLRGDANGDRVRDLTDGVFVLDYLFQQQAVPSCPKAADADDNGRLDLTDAVSLLNFLFLGGSPLPTPSDACGDDPTRDELACDDFQGCP